MLAVAQGRIQDKDFVSEVEFVGDLLLEICRTYPQIPMTLAKCCTRLPLIITPRLLI